MNPYEFLNPFLRVAGKGVGEGNNSCGGSKIEVQHAIDDTHVGTGEHQRRSNPAAYSHVIDNTHMGTGKHHIGGPTP